MERYTPFAARDQAWRKAFCFWKYFFIFFFGGGSEAAMGGGAQRPECGGNELKKTGSRSARARTRRQNPLVANSTLYQKIYKVKYVFPLWYISLK
jgi:hypothetical protein